MRAPCGTMLMKTIIGPDGKKKSLYPQKIYCYQSLKVSLQRLINRKDVLTALLKKKTIHEDVYFDVYDGEAWQTFKDIDGNMYFDNKRNLAGIFNIDWFQPFDSSEHSLGVLYLVLLNLPREVRFKTENVIIVGIIPGPKEPELNVNSYLRPFVNELIMLWKGVKFYEEKEFVFYRFAVLCIASDLPATRKSCGFLSYNAERGINIYLLSAMLLVPSCIF